MGPRFAEYNVLDYTVFTEERARSLATLEAHWQSVLRQDIVEFGRTMRAG
jgi:hypothetical protein